MSTPVTYNGTGYVIPAVGDANWGVQVSAYLIALSTGSLQKTGGAFTLSGADVAFGANYGLQAIYYKSNTANIAASGVLRLANADAVAWRNAGNTADLALALSGNVLTFNSIALVDVSSAQTLTNKTMDGGSNTFTNLPVASLTGTVPPNKGGTGVSNNALSTITITGNFPLALTLAASTSLTLPSSGTLATLAGAETLTNKTLTTPTIAQILNSGTLTLPTSTDTLVGRATTDTLTNKTLTGPVQTSYEEFIEVTTPSNPAAGRIRLYAKSGDGVYTLNSSGTETQLGSGSGEKNYLQASTSTATGWTAVAGTGATTQATVTISTDITAADLPRPITTKTGIKFATTAASGGTPVAAFGWATFQLDPADYGKKLKVQFDQNVLNSYASSDFQVQVVCSSSPFTSPTISSGTRLPLSTDSPSSVSGIPALEGTYRTTFDAPGSSTPYIMIMFIPKTTVTSTLVISDLIVGPGTVAQAGALSGTLSYTPTITGYGTVSGVSFFYRQVGGFYQIWGCFTGGTASASTVSMTLPNGYSIDAAQITSDNTIFGLASCTNVAPQGVWTADVGLVVFPDSSDYTKAFICYNTAASVNMLQPVAGSSMFQNNKQVTIGPLWIPIAQLTGGGTVNVVQNDVEYLSNSDTSSTASVTASGYQYGPAGQIFGSNWSTLGTQYVRRVQTISPISSTDELVFQVSEDSGVTWGDLATGMGNVCSAYMAQGTSNYGVQMRKVDATHVDLFFNAQGRFPNNATYAGNGGAWSGLGGATYFWRVVKRKQGQATGFGIVNGTSAGLVPASNTNLDNASATRLGLMQYSGANAPTVTLSAGGGTLSSIARAVFVPYQTNDGSWRMRFNIVAVLSSATRTNAQFAISGATFKNTAGFYQAFSATDTNIAMWGYVTYGTGTIIAQHASATTVTYSMSGDLELDSKPTWAF